LIFALLPVKAPQKAKQRLGTLLPAAQREDLARAMYEHVLAVLCQVRGIDRVVVATSDKAIAQHARRSGALVFEEREQLGHSQSADTAARRAKAMGAAMAVMVPIDVPLVTAAEIEDLIAGGVPGAPHLVIVPSADGAGTNALVRTPPDVIESRFGPGSFQAHCEQARSKGIPVAVARPPGLLFDIDTPDDVVELLARAPDSRVAELLRSMLHSPAAGPGSGLLNAEG
jgi:2-phospho-L-lactate guanylyltransferase